MRAQKTHDSPIPEHLRSLGTLLDARFQGPWGFRFGLDGLIGLIPVVGDLATAVLSLYIISEAALLGCSPSTLLRMGLNVLIENVVDSIPLVGNIFDFYWKANLKNLSLLEQHLQNPRSVTFRSRMVLFVIIVVILIVLIGSLYLGYLALSTLWQLVQQ